MCVASRPLGFANGESGGLGPQMSRAKRMENEAAMLGCANVQKVNTNHLDKIWGNYDTLQENVHINSAKPTKILKILSV